MCLNLWSRDPSINLEKKNERVSKLDSTMNAQFQETHFPWTIEPRVSKT